MNFANKKILILGGAYLHKKVVEAARELGAYTIVTDNVPGAPAKLIADRSYDINVSDVDAVVAMCRRENVEAVLTVCLDFCQVYYQQICEKLNLPCYGTREQFQLFTNKELFKAACIESGVDVIPSYTKEAALQSPDIIEYPVLIKPAHSRGSRGQSVCHCVAELSEAICLAEKCSENGNVIIEKYMEGKQDFQVTYLVVDGHAYVVRTADRYLGSADEKMDRVAISLSSPSSNTTLYFENAHEKVCRMLEKAGIVNAPVFMQGFVDDGAFRFYDPGLRFPGGDYDRIFATAMDLNLMKLLVEFAFTGNFGSEKVRLDDRTVYLKDQTIFTLHITIRPGTITDMTPLDELLRIEGVMFASLRHHVGDKIGFTGDVNQRIAEVNIIAKTADDLRNTLRQVQERFKVLDERGANMVFCAFDVNQWRECK